MDLAGWVRSSAGSGTRQQKGKVDTLASLPRRRGHRHSGSTLLGSEERLGDADGRLTKNHSRRAASAHKSRGVDPRHPAATEPRQPTLKGFQAPLGHLHVPARAGTHHYCHYDHSHAYVYPHSNCYWFHYYNGTFFRTYPCAPHHT